MIPAVRRLAEARSAAAASLRARWGSAALVCVLAVLSWPYASITPGIDADWNWYAGLAFAAEHGMRFGDQLAWTYGPLGFLVNGPFLYYSNVAALQLVYAWGLQLLLVATLLLALRRSYPLPVAFVAAGAVAVLVGDRAFALGFAWCVLALTRGEVVRRDRLAAAFPLAVGALAGIVALGKINQGIGLAAVAVVTLLARPGRRRLDVATFAGAAFVTAGAGWICTEQTLADVWPYLRNGKELVSGYAGAMGLPNTAHVWAGWGAALIAVLSLVPLLDSVRGGRRDRRLGLLGIWAIFTFLAWKQGFVRHSGSAYFANMLVVLAVVPVLVVRRAFGLAALATGIVLVAAYGVDLGQRLDPHRNARAAVDQIRLIADRDGREAATASLRQAIVARYGLPPRLIEEIGRKPMAFFPYSYGDLVYAHGFNWRPLPVLETYAAYTPRLDRLDAEMLASERAPERIVRSTLGGLDNRYLTFDAPQATVELLCRYRSLGVEGLWLLLARAADRCGDERVLGAVEARWDEAVAVPAPTSVDALVLVRIEGAEPAGLERIEAALLRPEIRTILLDGAAYRLVAATAGDGLLLHAPPEADYAAPFGLAPNAKAIAVHREGGRPGGTLRYTFVEVPIRPFPGASLSGGR